MRSISRRMVGFVLPLIIILAGCSSGYLSAPNFSRTALASRSTPTTVQTPGSNPASAVSAKPATSGADTLAPVATPTPLPATVNNARRQRQNGELAAALQIYRQLVSDGEGSVDVLLELGQVEMDSSNYARAVEVFQRVATATSESPWAERAAFLATLAQLKAGDWEVALKGIDVAMAPDGLGDLAALRRAEAAAKGGDDEAVRLELGRPEMRQSTNRMFLERGAQVAEAAGDYALAAELYHRGSKYPGWTVEQGRLIRAAAVAFVLSRQPEKAVEQYLRYIESYSWTRPAAQVAAELEKLGGLTPFHRGILAAGAGASDQARAALAEAAKGGEYAAAAQKRLNQIDESAAWAKADDTGTADGYRSFRQRYPGSSYAQEAWFREGMTSYIEGRVPAAIGVWDQAVVAASGEDRARLLLWNGKAHLQLGRNAEAKTQLQAAASSSPRGYYAVRAGDLLANISGWPAATVVAPVSRARPVAAPPSAWPGEGPPIAPESDRRVRRGLGLLALGMRAEAAVEMDGLIAESQDPAFLLRLSQALTERELWSSAVRAAGRVATLSPAATLAGSPQAVRQLAYPYAYSDLVCAQARQYKMDPVLLWALIRQESIFDPLALSVSDAKGLAQVIPSTGQGIANSLGRPEFNSDELYRPSIGVQFGAFYLAEQLQRFGNDPFRAIAAYNAGPGPVPRWSSPDPDLYVERIDYSQAKAYVRQIYVHYAIYRSLETPPPCAGQ